MFMANAFDVIMFSGCPLIMTNIGWQNPRYDMSLHMVLQLFGKTFVCTGMCMLTCLLEDMSESAAQLTPLTFNVPRYTSMPKPML